jgi:hypothetical protein
MSRSIVLVLVFALPVFAQVCSTSQQTLLKNDNLPDVPSGPTAVSVIPGLCEGEACAAVFDFTSIGPSIKVNLASVGYINAGNANGIQASADLELFDGVTFSGPNGSIANLGPSLFRWSVATGSSIGLVSSGINLSPDLSTYNIVAASGKLVCAWWMDLNPLGGSCSAGYTTNFATDNSNFQLSCNPAVTPPQKNLIYIQGQGWRDASKAVVSGFPLCPIFYSGNWILRTCVEPTTPPATLTIFGPPTPPPGIFLTLQFSAPGHSSAPYIAALSLGTSPGIPFPPFGIVPLNDDIALQFMIPDIFELPGASQNWAMNFTGNLDANGLAFGTFQVPPASGITLYFAFVTTTGAISNAVGVPIL